MSLCCVIALSALITATSQAETNHKQSQTQTLSKEQLECLSKPNTKGYMSMSNKETIAKNKLKYENTIFKTNMCGDCVVIEYRGANDITVQFKDTGFTTIAALHVLKRGEVKDRLKPSFYGVGVVGEVFIKNDVMYPTWMSMLSRCYGTRQTKENNPYNGCKVSENFRYYPYFKDWCSKQIGFDSLDDNGRPFALDKDILVKGNKLYSEDTCCFVPMEINGLQFSSSIRGGDFPIGVSYDAKNDKYKAPMCGKGASKTFLGRYTTPELAFLAYKEAKEKHIKEVANKWKDQIDPRVYEALMNWKVNIYD